MAQTVHMKNHQARMGRVQYPNTPESDLLPTVPHIVEGDLADGETFAVIVEASDPMTAIDAVNAMGAAEFEALERYDEQAATSSMRP